uniref:Putative dna damage-regulated autophagy modulator protein 1 n=1 Tax=Ixodes scapularis TaxID=6945 RepID=A0A4D5S4B0_IXOSC
MTTLVCMGIGWIPSLVGICLIAAALLSYAWAALTGAVTIYAPYISEAGASPPQSGLFSLLLFVASVWGCITMVLRFVVIRDLNRECWELIRVLNAVSLVVGLLAVLGNLIVASFPVLTTKTIHNVGAYAMFFNAVVYMILQTGLTCCLCPDHYSKAMVWLRLFLCVLAVFAVIFTACLQYIGEALWSTEEAEHPKHLRVPGDPGFRELTLSSLGEWLLVGCFLAFFFTFSFEFRRVALTVDVFPLVHHMDERIEVTRLRFEEAKPLLSYSSSL